MKFFLFVFVLFQIGVSAIASSGARYSPGIIITDSAPGWRTPGDPSGVPAFNYPIHWRVQISDSYMNIGGLKYVQVQAMSEVQRKKVRDDLPAQFTTIPTLWIKSSDAVIYKDMPRLKTCWPFKQIIFSDGYTSGLRLTMSARGVGRFHQQYDAYVDSKAVLYREGPIVEARLKNGGHYVFFYDEATSTIISSDDLDHPTEVEIRQCPNALSEKNQ